MKTDMCMTHVCRRDFGKRALPSNLKCSLHVGHIGPFGKRGFVRKRDLAAQVTDAFLDFSPNCWYANPCSVMNAANE